MKSSHDKPSDQNPEASNAPAVEKPAEKKEEAKGIRRLFNLAFSFLYKIALLRIALLFLFIASIYIGIQNGTVGSILNVPLWLGLSAAFNIILYGWLGWRAQRDAFQLPEVALASAISETIAASALASAGFAGTGIVSAIIIDIVLAAVCATVGALLATKIRFK